MFCLNSKKFIFLVVLLNNNSLFPFPKLISAVLKNDLEAIVRLSRLGYVNVPDQDGNSPLIYAVLNDRTQAAQNFFLRERIPILLASEA